jgi:hypothetical protein
VCGKRSKRNLDVVTHIWAELEFAAADSPYALKVHRFLSSRELTFFSVIDASSSARPLPLYLLIMQLDDNRAPAAFRMHFLAACSDDCHQYSCFVSINPFDPPFFVLVATLPAVSFVLQNGSVRMHDGRTLPFLCFVFPNLLLDSIAVAVSFPALERYEPLCYAPFVLFCAWKLLGSLSFVPGSTRGFCVQANLHGFGMPFKFESPDRPSETL